MSIEQFLANATQTLQQANIDSARLDVLLLLEDILGMDRASILAHGDSKLSRSQGVELNKKVIQRASHLPLAYIRNTCLFYGRAFYVDQNVLVPRPETETIVELASRLPLPAHPHIADIGTGSGCIGISLALELPHARIELYDIDTKALRVAAKNATLLHALITVGKGDLCLALQGTYDLLVANLPYVPSSLPTNKATTFEPATALFAGKDGLATYRQFWAQIAAMHQLPRYVITEALPAQHKQLALLAQRAGYTCVQRQGFVQVFRTA